MMQMQELREMISGSMRLHIKPYFPTLLKNFPLYQKKHLAAVLLFEKNLIQLTQILACCILPSFNNNKLRYKTFPLGDT